MKRSLLFALQEDESAPVEQVCTSVCVCMSACVHECMCACVHTCAYVCMYVRIYVLYVCVPAVLYTVHVSLPVGSVCCKLYIYVPRYHGNRRLRNLISAKSPELLG